MKIHFIGICGAGMSAVAKLAKDLGHEISGSDEGFYPPISDYLIENNIPCSSPYKKENIPKGVEIIVIGKHAKLTKEENEEVAEAYNTRARILSFPELLKIITDGRDNIVISGSYGKSTCTSLTAWVLESSGVDAGYFIGAAPLTPKTNAHVGKAKEFVLEGDEYPSSNWDNTSKFLHYNAKDILVTATAHDHVNIFPTHDSYREPFIKLIEETPGLVVICTDEASNQNIIKDQNKNFITYGISSGSWQSKNIRFGEITTFTLTKDSIDIAQIETSLLGKHNIQNIVGVAALLLEKGLVTPEQFKESVKTFKGIKRRMDLLTKNNVVKAYEGFGSSYDKARAAIDAITTHYSNKELIIIFEPHTFSWRNKDALHWYDTVFKEAKVVMVYEPPVHGSSTHNQSTLEEIIERIKSSGTKVLSINSQNYQDLLKERVTDNSVVLILSSGDMGGMLKEIPRTIDNKYK